MSRRMSSCSSRTLGGAVWFSERTVADAVASGCSPDHADAGDVRIMIRLQQSRHTLREG